ncbi:kinase-like domain-containing protein [Rhizophagus clarus]|uniref:Kinase-like domain-containing protein n=1 Tax=Rhizophagus clarus TaxID=94130 RepID=A0A8H3QTM7_9GLOM|nr:kinase-like domain-containing protein [Rhizophagus clarus]
MSNEQSNLNNASSSVNNSLNYFSQIIKNFGKINIIEIEPTTKNINKDIFEGDLSIVIDELVNLIFKKLNKKLNEIILQEIYEHLLNNNSNSNSNYLLGYFNYNGIEIDINKQKAIELYQKAAGLGNKVAQLNLAEIYIDKNDNLAFVLSKKLAEDEYACGIHNLGWCYYEGIGTDGCVYEKGFGTNIDKQKAFELYLMAANLGYEYAQYNLAKMYEDGDWVQKDIDQAIYWYNKSAEQGHQTAQDNLNELLKK